MKKVILVFPDVTSMSEFLLLNKVSKAHTKTCDKELRGIVTDKVLTVASKEYGAKVKESVSIKSF